MHDSKCLLITAQMLQDKILCHQPSGTIHRLLCELIRQTRQSSFPPNYLHLGKYFHASMLTTERVWEWLEKWKGGWEKAEYVRSVS